MAVALAGERKPPTFPAEVWIVSITTFLSRSVGFLALFSTVFYTSMGLSPSALTLALFAGGFAGVLGSVAGGWSAARFGSTDVLIAGSLLNVPLLYLLGMSTDDPVPGHCARLTERGGDAIVLGACGGVGDGIGLRGKYRHGGRLPPYFPQ
ncbi:hypothetical protein ACWDT6_22840 [Nocardia grenadensis]|uniref:hypothetical protein n=1 Tax=Nocardia grenadensis TaxID=931537 RepID=UPI003D70956E